MADYYGYESDLTDDAKKATIYVTRRPNGSNHYRLKPSFDLETLPPAHVPVRFKYTPLKEEPTSTVYNLSLKFQKDIERIISTGSNPSQDVVYSISYVNGWYTAVYDDGEPVTVSPAVFDLIREAIYSHIDTKSESNTVKLSSTDMSIIRDEAIIVTIPLEEKMDALGAEYLAKVSFIHVAANNVWLRAYANRLSWRSLQGTASILVPTWSQEDEEAYSSFLYYYPDIPLPPPVSGKSNYGNLKLSDGNWYPVIGVSSDNIIEDTPIQEYSGDVYFEDEAYTITDVLRSQASEVDWRVRVLARVSRQLSEGLLPYSQMFGSNRGELHDSTSRLVYYSDEAGISVVIKSNNFIIGTHSHNVSIEEVKYYYDQLWDRGYFLTNYGHYMYPGSTGELDERGIRRLQISDSQVISNLLMT